MWLLPVFSSMGWPGLWFVSRPETSAAAKIFIRFSPNVLLSFLGLRDSRNGSVASLLVPIFKIDKLFIGDVPPTALGVTGPLPLVHDNPIVGVITILDIILLCINIKLPLKFWPYLALVLAVPINTPFRYIMKVTMYSGCSGDSWIGGNTCSGHTDWLPLVLASASGKKNDSSIVVFRIISLIRVNLRECQRCP